MANKKDTTKSTANNAAVDNTTAADIDVVERIEKEEHVELTKTKEETKKQTKRKSVEPLHDYDEIEVISLISNVSYKDSKTGDMYEWDDVDHIEFLTFETLKNMWRNSKGYFKNMWLKPLDDRVINKFGLTKTFEKYEFLMDASNYTSNNIKDICESISNTPNGLKRAVCNKIKLLVVNGDVTDVRVVRALEKYLNIELIDFL